MSFCGSSGKMSYFGNTVYHLLGLHGKQIYFTMVDMVLLDRVNPTWVQTSTESPVPEG